MRSTSGAVGNLAAKEAVASWIAPILTALKPPEKITVSQWADENRILDEKSSNEPGRWKTSRTPYLKAIMDTCTDPEVEEAVFVKPTQVGGTECILNILGYIIDQDGAPVLIVYPTDTVAEHVSKNRIQIAIQKSDVLRDKYDERGSKLLELQFPGMYIGLTGANTPSQLANKPIRFLLLDEVDKFPPRAGKESDPISLARQRTMTFKYNRFIFYTSTPTYKDGPIWTMFEECETQYHYYVPCPRCGKYQRFRWRWVKFDKQLPTDSEKANSAFYECMHCQSKIVDADKADMLAAGEWRADKMGSRRKVGFHLNAIYSPWVTFRDVVAEFLASNTTPEKLMNFINSWLAEPFEQVSASSDREKILERQGRYTRGIVPDEAQMITGGVDKQRNCYYYTIRAWGENRMSWNIDHGRIDFTDDDDPDEILLKIFDKSYHDERGNSWYVDFVLIDSGNDTDSVYDFCYVNQPLFAPLKGSSNDIPSRYRESVVEKKNSSARGMRLIICDGGYYKDMIFRRINSKRRQDWFVYDGCDEEYARQLASEHKVADTVAGRTVYRWKPKASGADNHYLDCEVYAACAADVIGAFELLAKEEDSAAPATSPAPKSSQPDDTDSWLSGGDDWI